MAECGGQQTAERTCRSFSDFLFRFLDDELGYDGVWVFDRGWGELKYNCLIIALVKESNAGGRETNLSRTGYRRKNVERTWSWLEFELKTKENLRTFRKIGKIKEFQRIQNKMWKWEFLRWFIEFSFFEMRKKSHQKSHKNTKIIYSSNL